jgi:hypothetical protein
MTCRAARLKPTQQRQAQQQQPNRDSQRSDGTEHVGLLSFR